MARVPAEADCQVRPYRSMVQGGLDRERSTSAQPDQKKAL
jgi:hypothetical protein